MNDADTQAVLDAISDGINAIRPHTNLSLAIFDALRDMPRDVLLRALGMKEHWVGSSFDGEMTWVEP